MRNMMFLLFRRTKPTAAQSCYALQGFRTQVPNSRCLVVANVWPQKNPKSKPCLKKWWDTMSIVRRFNPSVARGHPSWFFDVLKQWWHSFAFSLRIHLAVGDFQNEITPHILGIGFYILVEPQLSRATRQSWEENDGKSFEMQEIMLDDGDKSEEGYCGAPQINLHLSPLSQRCSSAVDVGSRRSCTCKSKNERKTESAVGN